MKSFRKFSQRKENRDYMNQEESVYELNRIQRYIMQMRPLLKKNALFSDGTADYRQPVEPDAGDEVLSVSVQRAIMSISYGCVPEIKNIK